MGLKPGTNWGKQGQIGKLNKAPNLFDFLGCVVKTWDDGSANDEFEAILIIAKFFNPTGAGTWYATEYDPDNRTFFGYVSIFGDWNDEWGYFSLDELENYKGRFGLGIERDLHFDNRRASQVFKK